jgi:vancomycin permeability regulator SanA
MMPAGDPVLRGFAFALSGFALLNLVAEWRHPGFDPNLWWVDFPLLPPAVADALLILFVCAMLSYALAPVMRPWRRSVVLFILVLVLGVAAGNAATYYRVLLQGAIRTSLPVPFSLLIAMQLGLTLMAVWRRPAGAQSGHPLRRRALIVVAALAWLLAFPLAQFVFYGKTDYRRPADAIVVLGARVYASGQVSTAVADRVATGCALFEAGYAPALIMSGGPGEGAVHETEAMRRFAIELGVPAESIVCDTGGLNTQATVDAVRQSLRRRELRRVLAVSHYWHLPRIKLAAGRDHHRILTVPAVESARLRHLPYQLTREVAAFWMYYAQLLIRG